MRWALKDGCVNALIWPRLNPDGFLKLLLHSLCCTTFHKPEQRWRKEEYKKKLCFHVTVVWWMLCRAPLWFFHVRVPHRCHIGCVSDRQPQRLIIHRQHWPVHTPSITAASQVFLMASSAAICHIPKHLRGWRWVAQIHFIWIGTIRIMIINTTNPPVCFVLGISIAELIHWSFPRGFGERVWQNAEFSLGSTGHCI